VGTRIILILAAATLLAGVGCGSDERPAAATEEEVRDEPRTAVVAAFYPLAYAAERIGGEGVEVTNLTPVGAEPHDVELTARDVERVHSADVVLYLGGGFQPALERILHGADARTVDLLEGLELRHGADVRDHGHGHEDDEHGHEDDEHGHEDDEHDAAGDEAHEDVVDPHVWLDPVRYASMVRRIGVELAAEEQAAELVREPEVLHEE
jgi:zinc transport system substrate-binding protein